MITYNIKNKCPLLYNLDELSVKSKALKIIGIIGLLSFTPLSIFIIPLADNVISILNAAEIFHGLTHAYGKGRGADELRHQALDLGAVENHG